MADTLNDNTSSTIYRPVEQHEKEEASNLWYTVFDIALPGCYDRYFAPEASPRYQLNDTLGAWYNGKLVSAIHVRRRLFQARVGDRTYLCACFSNVATFEEYRKRGYSRQLLRMALENMKQSDDFDVALLQTRVPSHYSALGWEQVPVPAPISIVWKNFNPDESKVEWRLASDVLLSDGQRLLDIYSTNPRPYQLDRSPLIMFQFWTNYYWKHEKTIIAVLDIEERDYVAIESPNNVEKICVSEWRALNVDVEKMLFKSAAIEIRRRHPEITVIRFQGVPQHMSLDECRDWAGPLTIGIFPKTMLLNLRLSRETFEDIKAAYSSGEAAWWKGDYF